jgi:DNA-binding NtrC family response regulator
MYSIAQACRIVFFAPDKSDLELVSGVTDAIQGVPRVRLAIATSLDEARSLLGSPGVALLLVHVRRPEDVPAIADLVRAANALVEPVKTVVLGERGQTKAGLTLLRAGVADYLERPLDMRRLALLTDVLTVRARLELARPATAPTHPPDDAPVLPDLAGPMRQVLEQVRRVAPTDSTVLLEGETGTGKTRLARAIHNLSPRRHLPLLVVNCAALSATLIESEMFGHVRGAFTGADRNRTGKFAEAAGGTLVLDEIDSLPIELQAKLLRVVEERVFEPVGSNASQPMRARLIATANRPLGREAEAGRFRSDLFFRLSVVTFELAPLRDRREVLPVLVGQFVRELGTRAGRSVTGVTPTALAALTAYAWPGNVRELRNVIERAVVLLSGGEIGAADLPDAVRAAADGTTEGLALADTAEVPALSASQAPPADGLRQTLAETASGAEAVRIIAALQNNNNNRGQAASELGISRETLYKKLHRYGLFDSTGRGARPADSTSSGSR